MAGFSAGAGMFAWMFLLLTAIPTASTLACGYYWYRAKHSSGPASDKVFNYFVGALLFFLPNLMPIFVMPRLIPALLLFYVVVAALLVLFVACSGPEKRWPAFVPGVLVGAVFLIWSVQVRPAHRRLELLSGMTFDTSFRHLSDRPLRAIMESRFRTKGTVCCRLKH